MAAAPVTSASELDADDADEMIARVHVENTDVRDDVSCNAVVLPGSSDILSPKELEELGLLLEGQSDTVIGGRF